MSMLKLPSVEPVDDACDACASCVGRRDFLRVGVGATLAAALLGGLPEALAAAPIRWVRSSAADEPRYPVPTDDSVQVDRKEEIILVRYQGELMVFSLACPHQHALLKWLPDHHMFRCTKHHSEYSPTGVYEKGRATRNMDRYAISIQNGQVVVDKSKEFHSDKDPQGWAAAEVTAP